VKHRRVIIAITLDAEPLLAALEDLDRCLILTLIHCECEVHRTEREYRELGVIDVGGEA
jgi:hypothetical protein